MGDRGGRRIGTEAARHILTRQAIIRHKMPSEGVHSIGTSGLAPSSSPHPFPGSLPPESKPMRRRFTFITVLTLAAASPASALDRLVDIGNDHWVEVSGEGSVNAPPDFARVMLGVTNTGKTAGEPWRPTPKRQRARFAHQVGRRRSGRHPRLRRVDFAGVLSTSARPTDHSDDHRL
jgi:hypothetical protein